MGNNFKYGKSLLMADIANVNLCPFCGQRVAIDPTDKYVKYGPPICKECLERQIKSILEVANGKSSVSGAVSRV